jgi:hypothetical protein
LVLEGVEDGSTRLVGIIVDVYAEDVGGHA